MWCNLRLMQCTFLSLLCSSCMLLLALASWTTCILCQFSELRKQCWGLCTIVLHYGHVLYAAHIHELLRWAFPWDKRAFNLSPLVLKARHLSGSVFCWIDIGLPEKAVVWFPRRFGIGCGRWTYWAFMITSTITTEERNWFHVTIL